MTRKLIFPLLIALLLAALFVSPALADKAYRADRFDVQLDLLPGGDMIVTETVVFRFEGGPFTYAFRDVSANRTDGLTFLEASMDGVLLPPGTGPGQVEVQPGDPLKVTWHFAPVSDSTHTFVLRYRVTGVVSTGEADTLRWYVIPPEHDYWIGQSTIGLNYPAGVQALEPPSLDRAFEAASATSGFVLTTTDISDDESVILTVRFPAGSLADAAPAWQAREQAAAAAARRVVPLGLLSSLAALLLGGLGLFAYARADRRALNLPEAGLLPAPPDDRVPPAVAGKLIGQEIYSPTGALFDLAQRGVVHIREERGLLGSKKFIVERKKMGDLLHPHEQGLLQAIFSGGETQVDMKDILTRLASQKSYFYDPLEQELVDRGWLDPERKYRRRMMTLIGLLGLFLGTGLCIGGATATGALLAANQTFASLMAVLTGLGGAGFMLSLVLIIYSGLYSPLTPAGEEQKVRWKSFRAYLEQVGRGREAAVRPDLFERYLAFAAAFGLGETWARAFQKLGGAPLPTWFHSLSGSDDFGAMVAVMSAADTSASFGGDGGGGASGGGSSGAG